MNHSLAHEAKANPALGFIVALSTFLLAACGGGGGTSNTTSEPTVSNFSASDTMYSQKVVATVTGSNVNSGLAATSTACTAPMTLSTATPLVSDASTAYYTCTAASVGTHTVALARSADGAALGSANVNVPMPQVTMTVSNGAAVAGTIVFTLAPDKAPITVANFLRYVNDGFYKDTVFHRVAVSPIPFVIQGGGVRLSGAPTKGVFPPIALEVNKGLSNVKWSLAMARTGEPNSATSQFFVNLSDNLNLNPGASSAGYAVFGHVSAGTDVVTAITTAPCQALPGFTTAPECTPIPAMVITSMIQTQ